MDIAAGSGRGTGVAGCAPAADLVFVECSTDRLPWDGHGAVGVSFGDSVQLLEAVQYVFEFAGARPCVVNLSLGTNGGPHDGSTLVEQGLDALLRGHPNRAIVIAASNSQADNVHATLEVAANGSADLGWITPPSPVGHELEIWAAGNTPFAVELFAPDGTSLGTVEPGENLSLGQGNQPAIFIANRLNDPNNHDNFTGVFLAPGLPAGTWRVRVHSRSPAALVGHAWIERSDDFQSSFLHAAPTHCLGSISCGHETIVVGSFDAHKPNRPMSFFSSAGPTRDGRQKPELSAAGHAVLAANAGSGTGAVRKSGTSMAAPAVTGLVALMLAAAQKQNRSLTVAEIRNALINHVNQGQGAAVGWDPFYGFGRASAASVL
jgi:subtilisin family serine protease